mmetsp:Transcript_381/g.1237  ORF Transcript_381/g.1237 Transcript_381/m.1237 type:complete len:257 (-) Transcript_381:8-778(-)
MRVIFSTPPRLHQLSYTSARLPQERHKPLVLRARELLESFDKGVRRLRSAEGERARSVADDEIRNPTDAASVLQLLLHLLQTPLRVAQESLRALEPSLLSRCHEHVTFARRLFLDEVRFEESLDESVLLLRSETRAPSDQSVAVKRWPRVPSETVLNAEVLKDGAQALIHHLAPLLPKLALVVGSLVDAVDGRFRRKLTPGLRRHQKEWRPRNRGFRLGHLGKRFLQMSLPHVAPRSHGIGDDPHAYRFRSHEEKR